MLLLCGNPCKVITRLKSVPGALRAITSLDAYPASGWGQQSTIGLRISFRRYTVVRAHDLRDRHGERGEINVSRVCGADENQAGKRRGVGRGKFRRRHRTARVSGYNPSTRTTNLAGLIECAIEEDGIIRAAECAAARQLDESDWKAGSRNGARKGCVCGRIYQRARKK